MGFVKYILAVLIMTVDAEVSLGAVTVYYNKADWQSNAGAYSTITFTELPANTWIDEQYSYLGVHFTDGSDQIYNNTNIFADGFGLNGALDSTTLKFDAPTTTIGMEFPGGGQIKLYSNGKLIYTSPVLGVSGVGNFGGLVSTEPFDSAFLYDPFFDGFFADNVYFGPPIPAPPVLAILGVAALLKGRRRRRG